MGTHQPENEKLQSFVINLIVVLSETASVNQRWPLYSAMIYIQVAFIFHTFSFMNFRTDSMTFIVVFASAGHFKRSTKQNFKSWPWAITPVTCVGINPELPFSNCKKSLFFILHRVG